jgi:hypothetical protein
MHTRDDEGLSEAFRLSVYSQGPQSTLIVLQSFQTLGEGMAAVLQSGDCASRETIQQEQWAAECSTPKILLLTFKRSSGAQWGSTDPRSRGLPMNAAVRILRAVTPRRAFYPEIGESREEPSGL